jgi:hypothetical protein
VECTKSKVDKVRIAFLNCCGIIRGKVKEINELIEREEVTMVGCCETWLRKEDSFKGVVILRKDDQGEEERDSFNRRTRGKRGILVLGSEKFK